MNRDNRLPAGVRPVPVEPIVPLPPGTRRQLTAGQVMAMANRHFNAGEYDRAQTLLQQLLGSRPDHAAALHLSGVICHQLGDRERGLALVSRAIELSPDQGLYHSNLAEMLRIAGRLEQAVRHGERAVELEPDNALAHSNLGIACYDLGDYDRAEACQLAALRIRPDLAAARNNLGSICRARKDIPSAISCYEQVLAEHPDHLEAMNNLGAVLTEDERYEEAVRTLQQVIRRQPDFADAHSNIGNAFIGLEKLDIAEQAYRRALDLRPEYAEPCVGLARVYNEQGEFDKAEAIANRALEIDPAKAEPHCVLALVYAERGFPERAMASWERALEQDPELLRAWIGKGSLSMELGDMDEAERSHRRALAIDPDSLAARLALTQVRKARPGDENLLALERRAADLDALSPSKAMALHFALGKCYDDTGDYARAFPHFLSGCELKRRTVSYAPEDTEALVDRLVAFFTPERFGRFGRVGNESELPVFVLGMARSGTTLTEQIIASHPEVHGAGELPDLLALAHSRDDADASSFYPDSFESAEPGQITALGDRYVADLRRRSPDARRITDKMPANFFAVGLIQLMLPGARIIHVRRNPLDTCISGFSKLYNRGQLYSYDLAELGHYYRQYARLMAHWKSVLPEGRLLDVCYEDLVADQETEARRMISHCGLEWSDSCLDFHNTRRSVRTASVTQVRQPIYRSSVERWRRYEDFLQPLRAALGPELAPED